MKAIKIQETAHYVAGKNPIFSYKPILLAPVQCTAFKILPLIDC